ncbi:MAG: hypothetical protein E7559_09700 [Ruminococcaceae bacterium]|nr:hypothetical protein [Oscillospiraceae bacterium]
MDYSVTGSSGLQYRQSNRCGLSVPVRQLITAVVGAIVCFGLAVLLHYAYDWSGERLPVAVFASVNESVWEHIKILLWPFLLWSIAEYYILRPDPRRLLVGKTVGALAVAVMTICFFFVYSGILGRTVVWVDISSAFLWLLLGELVSLRVLNLPHNIEALYGVAAAVMTLIVVMLLCFTASPPRIGLFADPETGLYGLETTP